MTVGRSPLLGRRTAVRDPDAIGKRSNRASVPVLVLITSMIWPSTIAFQIGSLNMQIYKFALLFLAPVVIAEMLRRPIRFGLPDYFLLFFVAAQAISVFSHHGFGTEFFAYTYVRPVAAVGWENAGITGLEFAVPYFVARVFIRNREQLVATIKLLIAVVITISIFTWVEAITGFSIQQLRVNPLAEQRLGFFRSAGPFPHSILWGFFASSITAFAFTRMADEKDTWKRPATIALILGAAFTSLSSAAFLGLALQIGLIIWLLSTKRIKGRWVLLTIGIVALYLIIDVVSNRTPVHVFFSYATLNPWTGYYRLLIWEFGMQNFLASPFMGIGFNDWERLRWMTASVDAFWLAILMRYGLLGAVPLIIAFVGMLVKVGRVASHERAALPLGLAHAWMFSMVASFVIGLTVHIWGVSLLHLMFLAGLWGAISTTQQKSKTSPSRPSRPIPENA